MLRQRVVRQGPKKKTNQPAISHDETCRRLGLEAQADGTGAILLWSKKRHCFTKPQTNDVFCGTRCRAASRNCSPTLPAIRGQVPCPGPYAPPCDIPSGCCSFTGPWTVTRSFLRMLRRVAAFCRPLRPVLLLVSFPRSRSPVVSVLGLCWMWHGVPFARQRRPIIGVLRMCWLLPSPPPPPPPAHTRNGRSVFPGISAARAYTCVAPSSPHVT